MSATCTNALEDMTRRDALRLLVALGLWPLGCSDSTPPASVPLSASDRIVALRPDREAAALIGRTWLKQQSTAPSTAELLHELAPNDSLEADALREALESAHRGDLLAERYESVLDWQLSRTEVRLYALLARVI